MTEARSSRKIKAIFAASKELMVLGTLSLKRQRQGEM